MYTHNIRKMNDISLENIVIEVKVLKSSEQPTTFMLGFSNPS